MYQKAIAIGRTPELSLRVSAGVLNRVEMPHPETGQTLIVLERNLIARLNKNQEFEPNWHLQPLGGSSRLNRPNKLLEIIKKFNFENSWAKENQDFRLYIRPEDLAKVVEFTEYHFEHKETEVIRLNAKHEFYEELLECLGIYQKEHRTLQQLIEQTSNIFNLSEEGLEQAIVFEPFDRKKFNDLEHLRHQHPKTVHRIFNHIHRIKIKSENIAHELINIGEELTDSVIEEAVALKKSRWRHLHDQDSRTQASGLLITPLTKLLEHYQKHPKKERGIFTHYENYRMTESVAQILEKDLEP